MSASKTLEEVGLTFDDASLLARLHRYRNCLLHKFESVAWNSLDINYHPPQVHRIWTQIGNDRLMVHRIFPCPSDRQPLAHPHPWPSAVLVLNGEYEMGVGYGTTAEPPPIAAKVELREGSGYEMLDPNGWHYVNPLRKPSISLMLVGAPWKEVHPFYQNEKTRLPPLNEADRASLIQQMKEALINFGR